MKKAILLILTVVILITSVFAACAKKDVSDTSKGLENTENEVGFATVEVTDEDGKAVTDENGKKVTTDVAVAVEKNKAYVLGGDGEKVTDKKGNYVTVKYSTTKPDKKKTTVDPTATLPTNKTTQNKATTKKGVPLTSSVQTTGFQGKDVVPSLSQSGKEVNFSEQDMGIITSMLEVPYLYLADYENSEGVPIEIAVHTAVWMAEHEGNTRTVYAANPVVLNLFKYYGQTVVNFKTKCNEYAKSAKAPITYNAKDDTFSISEFTSKKQSVKITKIEDLGNNNYYKITASVTGCSKKKVVAIVQKNRLDVTLGFSVKALKWS